MSEFRASVDGLNASGSFTYTPAATFFGEDTFTYRSNDGSLDGTIATVRIVVQQTVTSGSSGTGGDDGGSTDDDGGSTDDVSTDAGTSTADDDSDVTSGTADSGVPGFSGKPTGGSGGETESTDGTTDSSTDSESDSQAKAQYDGATYVTAWRIDNRDDLRDRMTGRIAEDTGVGVFTSSDIGSMVYVLEQTGFWTELDNFEQDVRNSAIEQSDWEDLVVETTTVAGTTLTVGYIVWLLRSGSIVFGLISSLPAWTMMDPLPVLESGLAGLTDGDDSDDDSLQGILQTHQDATGPSEQSFEN